MVDLEPWRSRPGRAAVLTDFDGTLAPIVADPGAAWPVDGAVDLLALLVARYARVGAVSGRGVAFLAERLPVPGLVLAGLYGLERADRGEADGGVADGGVVVGHPDAELWRSTVASIVAAATSGAPVGVTVEDKGLTVTLHARAEPARMAWIDRFVRDRAEPAGLVGHPGKLSVELRPPVAMDKGVVVAELAAGFDAVCFCGDDLGDLPAFAAVAALGRTGVATLTVAAGGGETPDEVSEAADVVVDGPAGVVGLLRRLL